MSRMMNIILGTVICFFAVLYVAAWVAERFFPREGRPTTPTREVKLPPYQPPVDSARVPGRRKRIETPAEKPTPKVDWDEEGKKQTERQELIDRAIQEGVINRVEYRGLQAVVWVRHGFYGWDYRDKTTLCAVIWSHFATRERKEHVSVLLRDTITGKTMGSYRLGWGLSLE